MTQAEQKSPAHRAVVFLLIVAAACGLALGSMFLKIDVLSIAFVGPVMLLFATGRLEDSVPVAIAVTVIYIPILLIPTGIRFIVGKWTPATIAFQILFLLPNFLLWAFAFILSGAQM